MPAEKRWIEIVSKWNSDVSDGEMDVSGNLWDVNNASRRRICSRAAIILSFKRPTRLHRTATLGLPIIRNFHLRSTTVYT